MFVVDAFAVYAKLLVLLASAATLAMSRSWLRAEGLDHPEYPVLVLFATLGMMMMISANNFMALYLGLELQSLALYVLAASQRDSARATEAGLKYFVLGSLASGMLLYGVSLVYGFAGTTGFDALAKALAGEAPVGATVGMVFILAGLAFKISAAPFHMWAPDVYEGAPTPVTAFFAVAPKIAAFALLMRVLTGPFGSMAEQWQQVVVFVSIASMLVGAFGAIMQTNIKRLMAYSSIGHVGFALVGLSAGGADGVRAVLIYLAIYLVDECRRLRHHPRHAPEGPRAGRHRGSGRSVQDPSDDGAELGHPDVVDGRHSALRRLLEQVDGVLGRHR